MIARAFGTYNYHQWVVSSNESSLIFFTQGGKQHEAVLIDLLLLQDVSVPTDPESFKLEVPIYWQSLSRPLSAWNPRKDESTSIEKFESWKYEGHIIYNIRDTLSYFIGFLGLL